MRRIVTFRGSGVNLARRGNDPVQCNADQSEGVTQAPPRTDKGTMLQSQEGTHSSVGRAIRGWLAQWESVRFTSERLGVQISYHPPLTTECLTDRLLLGGSDDEENQRAKSGKTYEMQGYFNQGDSE